MLLLYFSFVFIFAFFKTFFCLESLQFDSFIVLQINVLKVKKVRGPKLFNSIYMYNMTLFNSIYMYNMTYYIRLIINQWNHVI